MSVNHTLVGEVADGAVVAVILAAGAGRRLGGVAKALLRRPDGASYLQSIVGTARAAGVSRFVVVVGEPFAEVTRAEANRLGSELMGRGVSSSARAETSARAPGPMGPSSSARAETSARAPGPVGPSSSSGPGGAKLEAVVNPAPELGMSSSVEVGFAYAEQRFGAAASALLWPVDHARVEVATVRRIIAGATPGNIVVPMFAGRGGHPGGFGRDLWRELQCCSSAEQGARSVLHRQPGRVVRIDVDDPGVVADVDSPADRECRED